MNDMDQDIKVIMGYHVLSDSQKAQFQQAIADGLKGKFIRTLKDDTQSILSIVNIWMKYGFLPMDQPFCAVDANTGDVLSILLLCNFKKPNARDSARCLFAVMRTIGIRKALKIAFNFLALDNLNKEETDASIRAEIYLVSTCEAQRGNGPEHF